MIMICKICNKEVNLSGFGKHLQLAHKTNSKDYYDIYLKKPGEDRCRICGNMTKFTILTKGYSKYCSPKCMRQGENVSEKVKQTCLKKYGVPYSSQAKVVREKVKQTFLEKYGVENPGQIPEVKEKVKNTCLEKYGVANAFQAEDIKDKIKQTCLEKYGVDNPSKSEEVKDKIKQVFKEKYGVENPLQCEEIKNKIKETNLERYGCASPMQNKDIQEKTKQTCLEKYGGYPMESAEVRQKSQQTCLEKYGKRFYTQTEEQKIKAKKTNLEKYGCENPMQNREVRLKNQKKSIVYDGRHFDSKWELAYYLHLKRNKIEFEYQPNISFKYEYNGKSHYYMPDFKVGDELIEIKGPQFFLEGKMINPFDRNMDGLYEAKHQCMIRNNVKIMTDCSIYIKEMKENEMLDL